MQEENKLARWLNNEMDTEELAAFTASAEFDTYRKIRDYSAQLAAPEANLDAMYATIQDNKYKRRDTPVRRINRWVPRIAAVLVLALGLTYFLYTTHTTMQVADVGKRTEFLLPDNSAVVLNAGSEASYKANSWNSRRSIDLNGEAFFKVAKGETFDVVTSIGTVTVVGTQFNVRARDNRFDVTCFEGKVKVQYKSEVVYLLAGESIAFEEGRRITIPDNDMQRPGWLSYETAFTAEKPENIIREIERQYNVIIKLDAAPQAKLFTGTIPMNDMDTALEIIKTVYHLKSEKKGNTILLSTE